MPWGCVLLFVRNLATTPSPCWKLTIKKNQNIAWSEDQFMCTETLTENGYVQLTIHMEHHCLIKEGCITTSDIFNCVMSVRIHCEDPKISILEIKHSNVPRMQTGMLLFYIFQAGFICDISYPSNALQ